MRRKHALAEQTYYYCISSYCVFNVMFCSALLFITTLRQYTRTAITLFTALSNKRCFILSAQQEDAHGIVQVTRPRGLRTEGQSIICYVRVMISASLFKTGLCKPRMNVRHTFRCVLRRTEEHCLQLSKSYRKKTSRGKDDFKVLRLVRRGINRLCNSPASKGNSSFMSALFTHYNQLSTTVH